MNADYSSYRHLRLLYESLWTHKKCLICKIVLGEDSRPPLYKCNSARLNIINNMQAITHKCIIPHTLVHIALSYASRHFFLLFTFLGKKIVSPHYRHRATPLPYWLWNNKLPTRIAPASELTQNAYHALGQRQGWEVKVQRTFNIRNHA